MDEVLDIRAYAPRTEFNFYHLEVPYKDIVPIGLDVGYSSTKVCSIFGRHIFPSFPVRVSEDCTVFDKDTDIKYMDENGNLWYVGDLAYNILESGKTLYQEDILYGKSRIRSEEYLVLLRVGLFLGLLREDFTLPEKFHLKIKTGLPDQYIMDDRAVLKERFIGHHRFSVKIGSHEWIPVSFDIGKEDITVISQPFGTLWSLAANIYGDVVNSELFDSKNVLIFDGGYHTVDTYFNKAGAKGTSTTWTNIAMNEIFKKTRQKIYKGTNESRFIRQYEIVKYLKTQRPGEVPYGNRQWYVFDRDLIENTEEIAKEAIRQLMITYDNLADVDVVVCTGGTGRAFYPIFKKNLRVDVLLAEKQDGDKVENFDAVFANVVGFFKCLLAELSLDESLNQSKTEDNQEAEKYIPEDTSLPMDE